MTAIPQGGGAYEGGAEKGGAYESGAYKGGVCKGLSAGSKSGGRVQRQGRAYGKWVQRQG